MTPRPDRLSCIEEAGYLSSGLESPSGDDDVVVHYGDYTTEPETIEVVRETKHETQTTEIPQFVFSYPSNSLPASTNGQINCSFKSE